MKRLLVCVLILNALLVGDRILMTFAASSGGNAGTAPCADIIGDVDASGLVDITDVITTLKFLFLDEAWQ
ncbi:MAG: hypothetical protein MK538_10665 [Planctomycetes bacterium]|nr:hypothetical protein [Planctomycetota bacterium]